MIARLMRALEHRRYVERALDGDAVAATLADDGDHATRADVRADEGRRQIHRRIPMVL
jgi:hypothetical protein